MSYTTCTALLFRAYAFVASGHIWPSSPPSSPTHNIVKEHLLPSPTVPSQSTSINTDIHYATVVAILGIWLLILLATTKAIKVSATRISILFALIAALASYVGLLSYSLDDFLATPQRLLDTSDEIFQQIQDVYDYYATIVNIALTYPYLRRLPPLVSGLDECARWHGAYLQLCIILSFARGILSRQMKHSEDGSLYNQYATQDAAIDDSHKEPSVQESTETDSITITNTSSGSGSTPTKVDSPRYIQLRKSKSKILILDHIATQEEIDVQFKRIKLEQDAARERAAARNSTYLNMLIYAIRDFWDDYKNSRNEPKIPIVKADNIQVIGRRAKAQSIKETMKTIDVPQIRDQRPKPEAKVIKSIPKITKPLAPACKEGRAQRKAPIVVFKFEDENKKHSRPAGQHNGYNYQVIGQGGFATVYKVTHRDEPKAFAVKKFDPGYREDYKREESNLRYLLGLVHPAQKYFVQMKNIWPKRNQFNSIAMELIGPDLHDFKDLMASKGYRTSIVDLQSIAYQLTDALRFMHDYKIIHADIKLVNIGLLSGDWYEDFAEAEERKLRKVAKLVNNQVRIFDLSLMEASVGPHRKRCGTRGFDPPEVVLDMAWSTPRDVWSLGMSLLIWYDCRPGNPFDLYELDRRFTPRETLIMWTNILLHPMPFNMVMQLLGSHDWVDKHGHLTPEQPMGDDIVRRYQPLATYFPFKHPMTTYLYYFIRDMLCVDPATRITAAKALHHGFLNKDLFTPRR